MVIGKKNDDTVKNTLKRFSIYVLALVIFIGIAAAGTPNITSYSPASNVSNIEGQTRAFEIEVNQTVNVNWYINSNIIPVQTNTNTHESTYTKKNAVAGTWIVNITASNEHGTVSKEWTWIVRRYGVNLTVDSTSKTSRARTNASYLLVLHNNGTVTDTYNLSVQNADSASTATLNRSENITLESGASQALILNVTNMSSGISGIFRVNVTVRSNNDSRKIGYINTTTTVIAVRGVIFTNISQLSNTTTAGTNATYYLNLTNNGTDIDSYSLAVTPDGASVASLNVTSPITLNSNETRIFTLNVTNSSRGIFPVNVTVTSAGNATEFDYINTTTNVTALRGVDLSNISALINTTTAGTNATYYLSLTNNGSDADSYNLTVTPGGASVASLNVTSVSLNADETSFLRLNVTNNSAGIFYVNVTAISDGDDTKFAYINTSTLTAIRGVNITSISALVNTTIAGSNFTYYLNLTNNGTDPDTYTLTVAGGGALVAVVNNNSVSLASNESRILILNVTNTSAGIFYVNVTASSDNDHTKFGYVNTTTTFINATGSINGTVTDVMLGTPIDNVTITLTNSTSGTFTNTTDTNGYYYIPEIVTSISNPYIYTISASKINYLTNSSLTVILLNSTTSNTTNIKLRAYNVTLMGSYIKNGTLIEVSGATVSLTNTTIGTTITRTTDSSGRYFASLYPATYFINVSKTGYSSNSTSTTVSSNLSISNIPLSPNIVTVTANRTMGSAGSGQNVSFNLTVVNIGEDATFTVETWSANASTFVKNTTIPSMLLLNTSDPTGYVVVEVNNSNFGGWPVTITISNSSQSKSTSITLTAIMRNASANYTNISSGVDNSSNVTGATLVNTTVQDNATVSGNSTLIVNATVTGEDTQITDNTVIRCDYGNFFVSNSIVGNTTVVCSNLTGSTVGTNATVTNSILAGSIVNNSTVNNVTVRADSTITNVASMSNIILGSVIITGDPNYEYEGRITGGNGWATYQNINFTKVYDTIRISHLVIEQSPNLNVNSGTNISINDTSLGTTMNFSMTFNLTNPAVINISETGISPDGMGFSSGMRLGNFLVIRSNDTNNLHVARHILRLYFDTDPSPYTGGVAINYFNTSTQAWEVLPTTGIGTEGGRNYREAVPDHFSTFALVGTTMTPTRETQNGGGGSSGVGGILTLEPYENIARSETYEKSLVYNNPVIYTFKLSEHGIYEIAVTGKESVNNIAMKVEVLKGPTRIKGISAPPGTVYKNMNIWAGSKRIKEGLIKFKVQNAWILNNNVEKGDLLLIKWDGSQWVQLVTQESMKDDNYSFYEANTDSFGSFAITALKGAVVPTTSVAQDTESGAPENPAGTENPTPVPTNKIPGFEGIIAVSIIALIGAGLRRFL